MTQSGVTYIAAAVCRCGHPIEEHAESGWGPNSVCVERLPNEDEGWYGVCPCVRHGEGDGDDT